MYIHVVDAWWLLYSQPLDTKSAYQGYASKFRYATMQVQYYQFIIYDIVDIFDLLDGAIKVRVCLPQLA